MPARSPKFVRAQEGATTVEFVVLFVGFIALMFFVVELTVYVFFLATLEKAAEAGVRVAVTSAPVVNLPATIEPTESARYGDNCNEGSGACVPFSATPITCTGPAECSRGDFDRIVAHMQRFNGLIQPDNVTLTYTDVGIGFAGGPPAPMVTVTVRCVPFRASVLKLFGIDTDNAQDWGCQHELTEVMLPPRSASMTGEDLAP